MKKVKTKDRKLEPDKNLESYLMSIGQNGEDSVKEISRLGKLLFSMDNLDMISSLSTEEIQKFSIMFAINEKLNSPLLEKYLEKRMSLAVSGKSMGRKDVVEIAKGLSASAILEKMSGEKPSFKKRLFG